MDENLYFLEALLDLVDGVEEVRVALGDDSTKELTVVRDVQKRLAEAVRAVHLHAPQPGALTIDWWRRSKQPWMS